MNFHAAILKEQFIFTYHASHCSHPCFKLSQYRLAFAATSSEVLATSAAANSKISVRIVRIFEYLDQCSHRGSAVVFASLRSRWQLQAKISVNGS
jgi:hypothetical protein